MKEQLKYVNWLGNTNQYTSYKIPEENGGNNKEIIKEKIITENFLALESWD